MKKTIKPEERKRIFPKDIYLNIKERENCLELEFKLSSLSEYGFPDKAKIILEAHNRINMQRIDLGEVGKYNEPQKQSKPLDFEVPIRAKINFRLKIIDPDSYKILGLAENLKEEKYAKSLLNLDDTDENVKNIFKIDFENEEIPILYLNPQLKPYAEKLKHVIAEMALKEILMYYLFVSEVEELEDNKWIKFASQFIPYPREDDKDKKLAWINELLCKFSEKKVINSIIKSFEK